MTNILQRSTTTQKLTRRFLKELRNLREFLDSKIWSQNCNAYGPAHACNTMGHVCIIITSTTTLRNTTASHPNSILPQLTAGMGKHTRSIWHLLFVPYFPPKVSISFLHHYLTTSGYSSYQYYEIPTLYHKDMTIARDIGELSQDLLATERCLRQICRVGYLCSQPSFVL